MRLGHIDLDTSHPESWVPIERELGCEVVGVWDGGDVRPAGYAAEFASQHHISRVYRSLEEMVGHVDAAIIHSCNWDRHLERARPFVEIGKPVLIDKPLAGNADDLRKLADWARRGATITGGSALLYCEEAQRLLSVPEDERGRIHTVFAGCAIDLFNYGIHAYSLIYALMGGGAAIVQHMGRIGEQRRVRIDWPDGRLAVITIGQARQWQPFYATAVSDRQVHQLLIDPERLYATMLQATLPYLSSRGSAAPPHRLEAIVEVERWALAAKQSWEWNNQLVDPFGDLTSRYDGQAFAEQYRQAAMRQTTCGVAGSRSHRS